jgi:hypothetical protein
MCNFEGGKIKFVEPKSSYPVEGEWDMNAKNHLIFSVPLFPF